MPILDFPWQDKVDNLKKKGLLKPQSKMEIMRMSNGHYPVESLGNFASRYMLVLFCSASIIYFAAIFLPSFLVPRIISLILLISCAIILIYTMIQGSRTNRTLLGFLDLSDSNIFIEFLNKFGKGWGLKLTCSFGKKWWLEYDILLMAYQWHKRDPVGFQQAFRKVKNKKELRIILGVN